MSENPLEPEDFHEKVVPLDWSFLELGEELEKILGKEKAGTLFGEELRKLKGRMLGMSLMDYILDYLKTRELLMVDEYFPYFIASVGSHIANLINRCKGKTCPRVMDCPRAGCPNYQFFGRLGSVPNLRFHILMIAPPGFMKNVILETFMDDEYGLLDGVPYVLGGFLTEAGYSGSVSERKGVKEGLAYTYCPGIIGFEEFSYLTTASKSEHSAQLENTLLMGLDSGRVRKDLAQGSISYETHHTLWGGTQFGSRYDVSSGALRRLNTLVLVPDFQLVEELKMAHYRGTGIGPDLERIKLIREGFRLFWERAVLTGVTFTKEYTDFTIKTAKVHTDLDTIDNLAIGYNMFHLWDGSPHLIVKLDDRLRRMIIRLVKYKSMGRGEKYIEYTQILKILGRRIMPLHKLSRDVERICGLPYSFLVQAIDDMVTEKRLGTVVTPGRTGRRQTYVFSTEYYTAEEAKKKLGVV